MKIIIIMLTILVLLFGFLIRQQQVWFNQQIKRAYLEGVEHGLLKAQEVLKGKN